MLLSIIRIRNSAKKRFRSLRRFFKRFTYHERHRQARTSTQDGLATAPHNSVLPASVMAANPVNGSTKDKLALNNSDDFLFSHSTRNHGAPAVDEPPRAIGINGEPHDGHIFGSQSISEGEAPATKQDNLKALEDDQSLAQPRTSGPPRTFQGAHHFIVNNPVFVASATQYPKKALERAMERLSEEAILDAELDSAARAPIPSCNPRTRQELRGRIISWLTDRNRDSNLLWLYGPAGAGKSAVAQTIAEGRRESGLLGAAFFFSRLNLRDDPKRVIPSLAHQLAVTFPQYKRLILHLLVEDPSVLKKVPRIQFQKFITELLFGMKLEGPSTHPILLLIDGLDECQGDEAQREFIELITASANSAKLLNLPFVWIVTSRPEWQIVSTFSNLHCRREELRIDTEQAIQDVTRILHDGFAKIRKKYSDAFAEGEIWPSADQLFAISSSASGLPVFASTVLRFVDDEEIGNPVARLDDCLSFLKGNLLPDSGNPLDPLHLLYWGIIRTIHPRVLPTTALILMFIILKRYDGPAKSVANILFLDQATFYASLRRLHSVLEIPSAEVAFRKPIAFRHASFGDFLKHILNSGGTFGLTIGNFDRIVEPCYQRWCERKNDEFTGTSTWKSSYKSAVA